MMEGFGEMVKWGCQLAPRSFALKPYVQIQLEGGGDGIYLEDFE